MVSWMFGVISAMVVNFDTVCRETVVLENQNNDGYRKGFMGLLYRHEGR
jgi:hypothetical protein